MAFPICAGEGSGGVSSACCAREGGGVVRAVVVLGLGRFVYQVGPREEENELDLGWTLGRREAGRGGRTGLEDTSWAAAERKGKEVWSELI